MSSAKRIIQTSLVLVLLLASFATTRTVHAWSACGSTYVVQPGDWLAKIARRCGVTLTDLWNANPWAGYYIYPGQVLTIPGGYDYYGGYNYYGYYCGGSWDYYGAYYTVCYGDTLGGIANYYGVSISYLQWRNGIPNANLIYPGQIIRP